MKANVSSLASSDTLIEAAVALLLVLSFSQGIWQATNIADGIPKALTELLSVALLFVAILRCKAAKQRFRGLVFLTPLVVACTTGVISGWLHGSSMLEQAFFLRSVLSPSIVFFAILNLHIGVAGTKRLANLLTVLILVQAPVFIWKWYAVGVNEKFWIGTLSQTAGQLGLVFPMLVLSLVLPWYLHKGRIVFALLILIFAFLPVVNEKRGVVIVIPAVLFFSIAAYIATKRGRDLICSNLNGWLSSRGSLVLLVCFAVWGGATKLIPSLYCENYQSCGKQTVQYISDYLKRDYASPMNLSRSSVDENTDIQLGRWELVRASFALIGEQGVMVTLAGFGAGAVNPSPHLGADRSDIMYHKFGLRGTYSSALALLYEAGVIAVLSMIAFFYLLTAMVIKQIRTAGSDDRYLAGLGILLMISVMAFDYFIYSITGWSSCTLAPLFFVAIGIYLTRSREDSNFGSPGAAD